jgi:MFS family permease
VALLPELSPRMQLTSASIVGRIVPSCLGDMFGRFNAMICVCALTTVFTLAIWIPAASKTGSVIFALFYGFTSGSFVALIPACVAQLSPTAEIGLRLGTNSLAVSVATLFGNPIAGALITAAGGSYIGVQLWAGLTMVIGTIFFILARLAQSRELTARV